MHVSVIVPVRNDAGGLRRCLEALREQTFPRDEFEVIVVDNGSTDAIGPVKADFPEVRWLFDNGPGSYSARNRGLREAKGRILAFTDSDCVPSPAWLKEAVGALESGNAAIVGGRIDYLNPEGRTLNAHEVFEENLFLLSKHRFLIEKLGMAATANLIARREVFDRVGPFDPALKSYGDGEWSRRAGRKGETLAYADAALVRHPRRGTFGDIFRKCRRLVGGRMSLLRQSRAPAREVAREVFRNSPLDPHAYAVALRPAGLKGAGARVRYAAMALFVSAAMTAEKIRLLMGGRASRGA
jgi:glycosyltransferase involved in cell wall biosynthesis